MGPLSRKLKEKFLCDLCDSSEAGGESMSIQSSIENIQSLSQPATTCSSAAKSG